MDYAESIGTVRGERRGRSDAPRAPRARELPLAELPLGREALVTRIEVHDPERVNRLASLGILPGSRIALAKRGKVFLASLDRYQVAFDEAVAKAVWVSPSSPGAP
jgi:Fe2+ transport system protein FeoA